MGCKWHICLSFNPIYFMGGNMLNKTTTLVIIAALAVTLSVMAGCRHQGSMGRAAFMMDYLTETLDLTEAQQALLKQYTGEVIRKGMALKKNQMEVRRTVVAQLKNETMDQQLILDRIAANQDDTNEMIRMVVRRVADFHQALTPEQRAKLVSKIETAKAFRQARAGRLRDFFQQH